MKSPDVPPPPSTQQIAAEELFRAFDELVEEVVQLRQLPLLHPIQKGIKSKEEMRGYILERQAESAPPEEVALGARVLKRLQLIPADMDLAAYVVDLVTEQLAGYYDPETSTFYIADWIEPSVQRPTMVHELAHALQDQHYDLKPFLKPIQGNDDQVLARMAIVEGDGYAVMLDYMLSPMGIDFRALPDLARLADQQTALLSAQYPILASAPPYLRESLLFPYTTGAAFVQRFLAENEWPAFDAVFRDLPVSTEQILHPEKYFFDRDDPAVVSPAPVPAGGRLVYRNVLGEFTLRSALGTALSRAAAESAAAGWDGDAVELIEKDGSEILRLTTIWDTPADAAEFCRGWRTVLEQRLGPPPAGSPEPGSALRWTDPLRPAALECGELRVEVTEIAPLAPAGQR